MLTTRQWADDHGIEPLATIGVAGQVAGPDTSLHSQPAAAITAAVERAGWSLSELDYPLEQTNLHGGAIALGHPVGASGGRLVVHAAHELARRGTGRAAVALCGVGGQGDALLLWR